LAGYEREVADEERVERLERTGGSRDGLVSVVSELRGLRGLLGRGSGGGMRRDGDGFLEGGEEGKEKESDGEQIRWLSGRDRQLACITPRDGEVHVDT
jgi:hypothetical protein